MAGSRFVAASIVIVTDMFTVWPSQRLEHHPTAAGIFLAG